MNQKGLTPIIVILMVVATVGALYLGKIYDKSQQANNFTKTLPEENDNQTIKTITDSIPKPDAVYLGMYENRDAVFVTNAELGKYYEPGAIEKFSQYKGDAKFLSGVGKGPFDYKDLEDPKRILNLPHEILQVNNFKFSDDKKFIYLSIMLKTKPSNLYPDNVTNHIYRVNLNTLKEEELWVHGIYMSPGKYKNARGATTINKTSSDNNYLVLSIYDCFACEGSEAGLIILNNNTKKERYFEKIGNVQFNLNENVFTYQKLSPYKESCGSGGLGCDSNNQRTVYKPSGEVFTETLP